MTNSIQRRVTEGKCLDDLATLMLKIESYGISLDGPESDVVDFMADMDDGVYFRFRPHKPAIRTWMRENRYHIDDKLRDECIDFIVMFEVACRVWNPREYPLIFFHVGANILKELPPGYPDVPKIGLVRQMRKIIHGWRSLGI